VYDFVVGLSRIDQMILSTNLAWLIPVGPFLAFMLIALAAHRSSRLSRLLALGGIVLAVILSQIVFWSVVRTPVVTRQVLLPWFNIGNNTVNLGIYLDPTDAVMTAMVGFVCLMIFIYSFGYMKGDPKTSRFFAYVSLFAGAMLGAMVCDNLLTFFVFWEIMGTCSYLLIGFWWEKRSAVSASLKAFLVTKTGDLFLLLGLVLLYAQVGSLAYADVFSTATVAKLAATPYVGGLSVATIAVLFLFGGTIGKSAQLPLHLWLPDAMEGPTPASALIHAATMVSAGVYLMIRAFPLLEASQAMPVVATVGTATALFAAIIAVAQTDIKRVLAFSTISQLGYMVAALGIGAYAAGVFHLITHAFFKALLFMAAGSVIHGVEHGHHRTHGHAVPTHPDGHAFSPNDMWQMGGLAFRMPVTAVSFLAGSMALSGFPLVTSGFWSKDEILTLAWHDHRLVFWGLLVAAGLTAFYSARQVSLTFLGKPRSPAATYARESSAVMVVPLAILAIFAIVLGWVGIPRDFPVLGRWLPGPFEPFVTRSLLDAGTAGHSEGAVPWMPLGLGLLFSLGGLYLGWRVYGRKPMVTTVATDDPVLKGLEKLKLGWLYRAMGRQFYVNEVVQRLVVTPAIAVSDGCSSFDRRGIDAVIVAFARGFSQYGRLPPTSEALEGGARDKAPRGRRWRARPVGPLDDRLLTDAVDGVGLLSHWTARLAVLLDEGLLDGIVKILAVAGRLFSGLLLLFDEGVVDGLVNATSRAFGVLGRWTRRMQNGQLADYLWNAFMVILLLIAVLILFQTT
jgi:NADH-quinone oxidoreductase subunit L